MLSKHHPILSLAMKRLMQSYNPNCWTCIGPKLISESAQQVAGTDLVDKIPASANFNFVSMKTIMSVEWKKTLKLLMPTKPVEFNTWRKLFAKSSAVHFFSHTTDPLTIYDNPQYSAYALLGPRYCPSSYYSTHNF